MGKSGPGGRPEVDQVQKKKMGPAAWYTSRAEFRLPWSKNRSNSGCAHAAQVLLQHIPPPLAYLQALQWQANLFFKVG